MVGTQAGGAGDLVSPPTKKKKNTKNLAKQSLLGTASVSPLVAMPTDVCRRHNYGLGIAAGGEQVWLSAPGWKRETG